MLKFFQKYILLVFLLYLLFSGLLFTVLNNDLALTTTGYRDMFDIISNAHRPGNIFNNPRFWDSPGGVFIRFGLEIFLTSFIMYVALAFLKLKKDLSVCIFIVLLAHFIFLFQIAIEFAYLKFNSNLLKEDYAKNFYLFSLHFFLDYFSIRYPLFLSYFAQTISLFEIAYWFVLAWIVSKIVGLSFSKSVQVIFSSYVLLLLIWLLFVSLMLFLNS